MLNITSYFSLENKLKSIVNDALLFVVLVELKLALFEQMVVTNIPFYIFDVSVSLKQIDR